MFPEITKNTKKWRYKDLNDGFWGFPNLKPKIPI